MKVSERSWHLRLARLVRGRYYTPRDLCGYFWGGIVWSLIIAIGLLSMVLYSCWQFVRMILANPVAAATGAAIAIGFCGFVGGGVWLILRWQERGHSKRPRWANPFVEYLRAKKRRLCPLIEVVPERDA